MIKRITVTAKAYKNNDGMALLITSPRTDDTLVLSERWFDRIAELMWVRTRSEMAIQESDMRSVPIAFTLEDLKHYWKLYKQQQRDRGKR